MNAPRYPYVIPTLIYRTFIKGWFLPLSSFFSWIAATMWTCIFGFGDEPAMPGDPMMAGVGEGNGWAKKEGIRERVEVHHGGYKGNRYVSEAAGKLMEERGWDASMFGDEVVK
jgi:hypothetical protein